jgi:MFS family permease
MAGSYRGVIQLQLANLFAESFAWSFVYLHAHDSGRSETVISAFFILMFAWAVVAVLTLRRPVRPGPYMAAGLGLRLVALLAVVRLTWHGDLMVAAVLYGTFIMMFWVPYNVVFMRMTTDADRAGRSTQLFAMFAFAGAVFPLVAGNLMERYGFWSIAAVACIVLTVGAVIAHRTPWGEPVRLDLGRAFRVGRRVTPLVFLEGFWQGAFWLAIWIGTLRMVDQGSEYGGFLAFLGVMAGVAAVLAGRWSDRARDRWLPTAVSGVGLALFMALVSYGEGDLALWSLLAGLAYFFAYMLMAFTFTVVAETGMGLDDAMGLREVMFNLGRAVGGGLFIATLLLDVPMAWPLSIAALAVLLKVVGYRGVIKGSAVTPPP